MKMKALLLILLACCSPSANAAIAFLQHCETGTSVTGRLIYIGTYQYAGQLFQRTFTEWCPATIEIY